MVNLKKKKIQMLGFALTEVLAVAAIVSSVPLSSYQRATQKAYETECKHNLRQLGQMINAYYMENGYYPKASFYPKDPENGGESVKAIIGGPKLLWICPSLPGKLQEKGLTFVYNHGIAGKSSLKNPAKKWVLIEMNCVSKNAPHPHPGGYNILFADGHVISSKRLPKKITKAYQKQGN